MDINATLNETTKPSLTKAIFTKTGLPVAMFITGIALCVGTLTTLVVTSFFGPAQWIMAALWAGFAAGFIAMVLSMVFAVWGAMLSGNNR
jgi:hypothetical protein